MAFVVEQSPEVRGQAGAWQTAGQTRWTIHPRSPLATPVMPVFGRLWKGYARRALPQLADLLEN
ncbi:hypothetical protein [[Mycobacterium] zoologicum]|uniref:hypothetical protein n=1 Tax=[Mycobacterium] zoologicum TaxID=2872311 RepID=UPI0038B690EB